MMKLEDIEAMTVEDLKSQKDELVTFAATCEPKQLAARYVKARLDAATRDDKLAEQGTTITNLNQSLQDVNNKTANLAKAGNHLVEQLEAANKDKLVMKDTILKLGNVAKLADGRRKSLARIMQMVNGISAEITPLLIDED